MQQPELIPHLFRTEFRKITSVLCKLLGIEHLEAAEDIASETFLLALETWTYKGIPPSPTGWLYTVAKNKARNYLHRQNLFDQKIVAELKAASSPNENLELDFSEQNISDSQLQMLFAICHPAISQEAQIGLALRILCGFGIDEIASAFLSNKETINKRLFRAREKLRLEKVNIAFPDEPDIVPRLETVLRTLYLLFSEGYYSEIQNAVLREDLCLEAMRLTYLLLEYERTNLPPVNALLALFCFQASRFKARKDKNGELVLYEDQDESAWDQALIEKGGYLFHRSARGRSLSKYHLEAGIAYWYTLKNDSEEKWSSILQLFNHLLMVEYSPIAALNRTYAFAKVHGKAAAIAEAEKLELKTNHFYYTLLGELYTETDRGKAREHFEKALRLAKTSTDKQMIGRKLEGLK